MKFNICVAIPIKSSDLKQNETIIKRTLNENPDLIELRFDYIDDIKKLTAEFINKLKNLIHPNIPIIFTMRDISEGGQIEISEKERLEIIKRLIKTQPEYFDIEMRSNSSLLKEIINLALNNDTNLIFSSHDFKKTQTYDEAYEIVNSFLNSLSNELKIDSKYLNEFIYKLIFTAQNLEDNLIPFKLCKSFSKQNKKIICFCMGELGIYSRVMCVKSGSFLTYGSLEDKTAPGQIHIKNIRELHKLLFNL
ncbi:MAG: type I 3-dehydroquinate dehydratase [Candidatus Hermodarchaeota archaeon]